MSSDTPELDAKKDGGSQGKINIMSFVFALLILIIVLIAYFCMSGFNLYMSKLAQANILPTNIGCAPYVSTSMASIAPIISNIFGPFNNVTGAPGAPATTMHIKFSPLDAPMHHVLIEPLRKLSEAPGTHFLGVYFADILKQLMCFNYGAINMYYNALNYIPESAQIAISPLLTAAFFAILMIIDLPYFVYVWFKSMSAFFKKSDENSPRDFKETISLIESPINTLIAWGFVILFIFILFFVIVAIPIINVGVLSACVLSSVGYKAAYVDNHQNPNKDATVWQIIKDTMGYHKNIIAWIFAVLYTMITFTNLGTSAAIITIVLIIILAASRTMDFFTNNMPDMQYLAPIIKDVKQAARTCSSSANKNREGGKTWLGEFIDLFKTPPPSPAVSQSGGGKAADDYFVLNKKFLKSLRASTTQL